MAKIAYYTRSSPQRYLSGRSTTPMHIMSSIFGRRFATPWFDGRVGRRCAHSVALPCILISSPMTGLSVTVFELTSWLQKPFRPPSHPPTQPSDPNTITITALEAIASQSGTNVFLPCGRSSLRLVRRVATVIVNPDDDLLESDLNQTKSSSQAMNTGGRPIVPQRTSNHRWPRVQFNCYIKCFENMNKRLPSKVKVQHVVNSLVAFVSQSDAIPMICRSKLLAGQLSLSHGSDSSLIYGNRRVFK